MIPDKLFAEPQQMTDPTSSNISGVRPSERVTESKSVDPSQAPQKAMTPPEDAKPGNEFSSELWNLSSDSRQRIQFAKIQYHLAYVVLSAMNAFTELTDPTENLPIPVLSGKVQEIARICLTSPSCGNPSPDLPPAEQPPSARTMSERMVAAAESNNRRAACEPKSEDTDELMGLLDFFSSEKTAHRLLDAAVIIFNAREAAQTQGTDETRRRFFESIGRVIDEAFQQVLQRAGNLTKTVQDNIARTQTLIKSGLQTLSETGFAAESITQKGSAMERLDTFCRESAHCFDRVEQIFARSGYNIHGMFHLMSTETFSRKA